jgi:hypothetical protein
MGTGEGQVNHRSGFKDELLFLRTFSETSVEGLKGKVCLNFHP